MNIPRLRLLAQHVARPAFDDPAEVVRWLGAVQAQDYLGALWAVGLRTRNATEAAVEDAIGRGALVRTWPMRGTLHLVAAADVRWMLGLLTPRVIAASASRHRQLELDGKTFARAARLTAKALEGGTHLERRALYALWHSAGISTAGARGLHILGYLAQTGLICFGPRRGKQHTFTLLEERIPPGRTPLRDEALGDLARRYFTSHGPATVHDFAWWSGLTVADARIGIELAGPHLAREDLAGRTYWRAPTERSRPSARRAYLLPAWDEYTVAYKDRGAVLDPAHAARVNAGGGVLNPVVVVGGKVVGTWRRTLGKRSVVVATDPFARLSPAVTRMVAAAARRYGEFLGLPSGTA